MLCQGSRLDADMFTREKAVKAPCDGSTGTAAGDLDGITAHVVTQWAVGRLAR